MGGGLTLKAEQAKAVVLEKYPHAGEYETSNKGTRLIRGLTQ